MNDASSSSSAPPSPASTSLTSLPSPELQTLSLRDVTDQDREAAAKLKAEANKAFTSMHSRPISRSSLTMGCPGRNFTVAVNLYSKAIELNPRDATFWCNRAAARTKLEEYGFALDDVSKAIEIDPKYAKAYYRRATCYLQIAKPQLAVADFKKVVALEPKNDVVRSQLTATQKLVRKIEFEKV
ncbi:hypothetical protein J3R82DRAFT_10429 [Butyriboletus roseoflavus]|nr:hypothetical protein J3R82DRAFT_10429 [Butyriboletus roseoflavus]